METMSEVKSLFAECPRCGQDRLDPIRYAMSRRDNRTHICAQCGTEEAIYDWLTAINIEPPDSVIDREMRFYLRRRTR